MPVLVTARSRRGLRHEAAPLFALFAGLLLLGGLVSYLLPLLGDAPHMQRPGDNLCGAVGFYLAHYLYSFLGVVAFLPLALILWRALHSILGGTLGERRLLPVLAGISGVALAAAGLFDALPSSENAGAAFVNGYGGYLGGLIRRLTAAILGRIGGILALILLLILSLMAILRFSLSDWRFGHSNRRRMGFSVRSGAEREPSGPTRTPRARTPRRRPVLSDEDAEMLGFARPRPRETRPAAPVAERRTDRGSAVRADRRTPSRPDARETHRPPIHATPVHAGIAGIPGQNPHLRAASAPPAGNAVNADSARVSAHDAVRPRPQPARDGRRPVFSDEDAQLLGFRPARPQETRRPAEEPRRPSVPQDERPRRPEAPLPERQAEAEATETEIRRPAADVVAPVPPSRPFAATSAPPMGEKAVADAAGSLVVEKVAADAPPAVEKPAASIVAPLASLVLERARDEEDTHEPASPDAPAAPEATEVPQPELPDPPETEAPSAEDVEFEIETPAPEERADQTDVSDEVPHEVETAEQSADADFVYAPAAAESDDEGDEEDDEAADEDEDDFTPDADDADEAEAAEAADPERDAEDEEDAEDEDAVEAVAPAYVPHEADEELDDDEDEDEDEDEEEDEDVSPAYADAEAENEQSAGEQFEEAEETDESEEGEEGEEATADFSPAYVVGADPDHDEEPLWPDDEESAETEEDEVYAPEYAAASDEPLYAADSDEDASGAADDRYGEFDEADEEDDDPAETSWQAPRFGPPEPDPEEADEDEEEDPGPPPEPINRWEHYVPPPLDLLDDNPQVEAELDQEHYYRVSRVLTEKLQAFNVQGEVVGISPGPVVTTYEFSPAPHVKISRIMSLADDLAMALMVDRVRVAGAIQGKAAVGIEIPNPERSTVYLKDILQADEYQEARSRLTLALGFDVVGRPTVANLAKMPHLLIAGATGAGKSVAINAFISSILFRARPDEVKLLMIDPKRIELSGYDDIPHLLHPVVVEAKMASRALLWAVREMERRYELLETFRVKSIDSYNATAAEPLPFIVIIVDELADLMMVASKDVETSIARLAQKARAAGMHIILATQRPSVDVLTGLIKANFPTRISFKVSQKVDSRTILDQVGAEHLLGMGDMLYLPPGKPLQRIHGAFISEQETERLVEYLKTQGTAEYDESVLQDMEEVTEPAASTGGGEEDEYDEKYDEAVAVVTEMATISVSMLQRRLRVGYNRAARMIDLMEREGIVGPADGSKPREVLVRSHGGGGGGEAE